MSWLVQIGRKVDKGVLNCDVRESQNSLWYQSSYIYLEAHTYYLTVTSQVTELFMVPEQLHIFAGPSTLVNCDVTSHGTPYGTRAATYICRPIHITEL